MNNSYGLSPLRNRRIRFANKPLFHGLLAVTLAVGTLMAGGNALAADKSKAGQATIEQRVERLERILRNQSLADIILQLQQLQQEVQQLRGEVELQNHTMDAMNKRQRDLYLDIDQRLSRMGGAGAVAVTQPPGSGDSSVSPDGGNTASVSDVNQPSPTASPVPSVARVVTPPDPKKESAAYQAAFNLLKQGRYKESIQGFRGFLEQYPGGNYEDNAQYWLGEASYVNRDFDTALTEFTKVVQDYPQSSKVPGALLKSGYIHYEKQDWTRARELFDRLTQEFANSTEARLASKRLERMKKEGH